jgi:YggT family protein
VEILLVFTSLVRVVLRIYILLLWVNRRFRPRGLVAVLVEFVYSVTDPPIKMFRKVLPPIRLGQIMLDLGWMLTLISCWILLAIIPGWW